MRQKIFVHIGPHKTGTSSLQRFLYANHQALLKLGVCYPTGHLGGRHAQHRFAFSVRGKTDPKDGKVPPRDVEFAPIFDEISASGADTAILSSEAFFATDEREIRILHQSLRDFDPVVVFYARRQDEGYVSSFTQRSKSATNRYMLPIHAHLDDPVRMGRDLAIHEHASTWARVFGKENVVARLYGKGINVPDDFLRCIDERRGMGPVLATAKEQFVTDKTFNISPSLEATEMTRLFKAQCDNQEQRRLAFKLLSKHLAGGRPAARLLSTADRRAILEFFRDSNEKLFREFFSSENRFAPELLLQGPETERETLTLDDTIPIIVDLIGRQVAAERATTRAKARRLLNRCWRLFGRRRKA